VKRREFVAALMGMAVPFAARAQQSEARRLGFMWDSPTAFPDAMEAFRSELRRLGYIEGQTIKIDYRYAYGDPDKMRAFAEEFAALKVDAIMAPSSIYTAAAKRATSNIPIIFMSHADPLGTGHVVSLARPGGNVTGLSLMMTETNVKLLELYKEAVPTLSRVAVVFEPSTPSHTPGLKALQAAGPKLGMAIQPVAASNAAEYERACAEMTVGRAEAALFLSTPLYIGDAKQLAELALRHRVPSLFGPRENVVSGGLMSYSPDRKDLWRRGAIIVDRVLKGIKPADLPVEQPTKFELIINHKTAKAVGVQFTEAFLARADEVIE
jgi:putative ABC transport system substrate-binding protein